MPVADRSSRPGATTTAFFIVSPAPLKGSASCTIDTPAIPGFSGWTQVSCPRAATRMRSPTSQSSRASCGSRAKPSACASASAYHMPPNATSTSIVPSPSTSSAAPRCAGNDGTFSSSTLSTLPSRQRARISTGPAGASSRTTVSGSLIGTSPSSSRTVATQIVFEPDIAGYSVGSMIT